MEKTVDTKTIYDFKDYKEIIQFQAKRLKQSKPGLTLKKVAARIPVQYTYLSKVLNSDSHHLSEDHLYSLGTLLELSANEIDFLILLRARQVTENTARKEDLGKKIDAIFKQRRIRGDFIDREESNLPKDLPYLLDPICLVVYVALFIKDVQKNPRTLCSTLGITLNKLKESLKTLEIAEYIEVSDEDSFVVTEVREKHPIFTRGHPLMRAHQTLLKALLASRMQLTSEENKESFMVTFTMDDNGLEFVRKEFGEMLKKIQNYTSTSKHTHLYQMSFDFLRWL